MKLRGPMNLHLRIKIAFVSEAPEATIPIAIKTPTSTFSISGLRSLRRKVNGKRDKIISVAMLIPEVVLDTIRKIFEPTHLAP
jgi:hypothetical protein